MVQQELLIKNRIERGNAYGMKALFLLFISVAFFIYKLCFLMDLTRPCIYDYLHLVLYPVNRWIQSDPYSIVILVGQLLVDGFMTSLFIVWTLKMKNVDLPNFVIIYYIMRTLYLKILYFPFPEDMVWRDTPVPSFFVPYDKTRDFFPSGHTGMAMMLSMEMVRFRFPSWVLYLSYFMVAWMPFMLISTRVHYAIDVIAAPFYVLFSRSIFLHIRRYLQLFWNLPYIIFCKARACCCRERASEDNRLFDDN